MWNGANATAGCPKREGRANLTGSEGKLMIQVGADLWEWRTIRAALMVAMFWCGWFATGRSVMAQQNANSAMVIQGGTVIDVRTGRLTPNVSVLIRGERIVQVGSAAQVQAPADALVVDAGGKFVMPGLWDTHAHTRDYDGDLNINHGVTSTMDMGNLMDWIIALQEAREKQVWIGPRIFPQGMSIGGTLGPHQWNAKNTEDAVFGAKQNIASGVSFLKVYQNATPEMVKAVANVAHAAGLNLHGHLGRTDAREAILAGINALAHGSGIPAATAPPEVAQIIKAGRRANAPDGGEINPEGPLAYSYEDPAKFDDLIKLMIEHDVRLEPNIVQVFHGVYPQWDAYQLETHRLAMRPELHYLREQYEMYVRMWDTDFTFRPYPPTPDLLAKLRKGLANHQLFARKFSAAGGKLMVGTDNYYHAMAGLAVWHEMELLADAQIPPLKILQGATINPAEFVHQDKNLGTIETGKLADIIILAKNPLEDIKNVRSLETVIQHGKVQELGYKSEYRIVIPRPYLRINGELPRPHISGVSPVAVPIGTKNLVLTIKGKSFNPANRVLWDNIDLKVLAFSPTEVKAAVPDDLVNRLGTWKVHMITGGRVHQEGDSFEEVMVTLGRRIEQRWNGQNMNAEF
jgi:imidazolonepropionase-like amidohydrolase